VDTINILIVDDHSAQRILLRKMLTQQGYKIHAAADGEAAIEILKSCEIDVVITDWLMPEMDGLKLTEIIRLKYEKQPIIIVLTAVNSRDAKNKALFAGADEYVSKPVEKGYLLGVIDNAIKKKQSIIAMPKTWRKIRKSKMEFYCVGIAASTGGPKTLMKFFEELGAVSNAAFLIVQHGPAWMLESFVDSLQKVTKMPVVLGEENLDVVPGIVYIAPGNKHMVIEEDPVAIHLLDTEPVNFVKPSADSLFRSMAYIFGKKSIGLVFTGMGSDASFGAGYIKASDGKVFVQDPKTAVLANMPDNVKKLNLADKVVPIEEMPRVLKIELAKKIIN
jgi:two-component system chemotaxis response regulator CheB